MVNLRQIFRMVRYGKFLVLLVTLVWHANGSQPGLLVLRSAAKGERRFCTGEKWCLGGTDRAIWIVD
jgi:hypothetical protein